MKSKIFAYALLSILGLGLLGVNMVRAHGWFMNSHNTSPEEVATRQKTMFERTSQILGISVDESKEKWAEGKTFAEIAQEKGITQEQLQERMKEVKKAQMRSHIQILVDQGVITQDQANKRLQFMENRIENSKSRKGFHRGFHF